MLCNNKQIDLFRHGLAHMANLLSLQIFYFFFFFSFSSFSLSHQAGGLVCLPYIIFFIARHGGTHTRIRAVQQDN